MNAWIVYLLFIQKDRTRNTVWEIHISENWFVSFLLALKKESMSATHAIQVL